MLKDIEINVSSVSLHLNRCKNYHILLQGY